MSQNGIGKIKNKLQELAALIKEETAEERKEIKEDLVENIRKLKSAVEERFQAVGDKYGDNIVEFIEELEGKTLKIQRNIKDQFSKSMANKDEIINKSTDSLLEAINKVKEKLQSK